MEHINDFLINLGLKGIARSNLHCVRQAEPKASAVLQKNSLYVILSKTSNKVFLVFISFCIFSFLQENLTWSLQ